MPKVLEGVRIINLATFQAGPFCTQTLADFGAEVIRIEPPGGAIDRELGPFAPSGENMAVPIYNRNKKGITLNLQTANGKLVFHDLIRRSDVLVSNLTTRATKSLGIDYASLKKVHPPLIYASITGYGLNGPYRERPTFDPICQAISGVMSITGFKDGPPTKSASLGDYGAGLYCAIGVLLALRHRDKTGEGQEIDIAILDTIVSFMEAVFAQYAVMNEVQPRLGNARPFSAPTDAFRCKDGYVYIAVTFNRMWQKFTRLIGREDLADDPRFATSELRRRNREYLSGLAEGWTADKTKAQVSKLLEEAGITAGPVNTVTEAYVDPQLKVREMLVEIDQPGIGKMPVSGIVIKMSETPGSIDRPSPLVGQHNEEVYCGLLGYSKEKLAELKAEGTI